MAHCHARGEIQIDASEHRVSFDMHGDVKVARRSAFRAGPSQAFEPKTFAVHDSCWEVYGLGPVAVLHARAMAVEARITVAELAESFALPAALGNPQAHARAGQRI